MTEPISRPPLTSALEDYLETIYEQLLTRPFTRVRDIAKARGVKPASVSPALKRLAALGLVRHERREYVVLTDDGLREARRVFARHNLLTRFFMDVLQMDEEAAGEEACAMEHNLSDEAMDRLTRFFEFLGACPTADPDFLSYFHNCSLVHDDLPACEYKCGLSTPTTDKHGGPMSIYDLEPGQSASIVQVNAFGAIRQRLLDMGLLPAVTVQVERTAPTGDPIWIRFQGTQLALRREEAKAVRVEID